MIRLDLFGWFLLLLGSAFSFTILRASDVGKIWPAAKKTWIDPEFGCEITQWTNHSAPSWHLYFNVESFIDTEHAIIFSRRSGKLNLFNLHLSTGEMVQMTDEPDLRDAVWHWPKFRTVWFIADTCFKALNTRTLETKTIARLGELNPQAFSVTGDGRWIVFSADQGARQKSDSLNVNIGPFALYRLDTRSGETLQISPPLGFVIGHVQASPTDPTRISYCWQHLYRRGESPGTLGAAPQRIWWISIDGDAGGPVGQQEFGLHRTHEFWFPDGSRIGYSARYKFGLSNGKEYLGSCRPDGSDNVMLEAPVLYAHSQVFKDGQYWVTDIYDGMVLALLTIRDRRIEKIQKLFRHDSSWQGQPSHPHPHFSPDGKCILFSTDKTGIPNVYTVKIDLN